MLLCIPFFKEFKDLNWLPVINRFEQCVIYIVFKFVDDNFPYYLNEVFEFAFEGNISLRNNFLKLKRLLRNTNTGQKALSFIGPSFWSQIPETLKKTNNLKLLPAIFCQIFIFSSNGSPLKTMENVLFHVKSSFRSRDIQIFVIFSLPFNTFQIQKGKWKLNNLWCHKLACINLQV